MAKEVFHFELIRNGRCDEVLLRCVGRIIAGDGAEREVWTPLLDSRERLDALLDMSGVTQFDAAGIGRLVELRRAVDSRGGSLRLVGASRRVTAMLRVTGVADMLAGPATPVRALPFRCRAYRGMVHTVMPQTAAAV